MCAAEIRGTSTEGDKAIELAERDTPVKDDATAGKAAEQTESDPPVEDDTGIEEECPVYESSQDAVETVPVEELPEKKDTWSRRFRPRGKNKK